MRATRLYLDIIEQEDININIYNSAEWRQFLTYFELDKTSFTSTWMKHYNTDILESRLFHWIRLGGVYRLYVLKGLKMCLQVSARRCYCIPVLAMDSF